MSNLTASQKHTAAQNLASVWNDGKRRVVVQQRACFRHGHQTIVKEPTEVIDDLFVIELLEQHNIPLLDLEVNGRPKKGQWIVSDEDLSKHIDALAVAFDIQPHFLHLAIEDGDEKHLAALLKALGNKTEVEFEKWVIDLEFVSKADLEAAVAARIAELDLVPKADVVALPQWFTDKIDEQIGLFEADEAKGELDEFGVKSLAMLGEMKTWGTVGDGIALEPDSAGRPSDWTPREGA